MKNSINRSIADEVFFVVDKISEKTVGVITLRQVSSREVSIGLLAVDCAHRRKGVAKMLLSRAVMWAIEKLDRFSSPVLTVVTQGRNVPACSAYQAFGFSLTKVQFVHHLWLQDSHVLGPSSIAQIDPIPFYRPYLTGREETYIREALENGASSDGCFSQLVKGCLLSMLTCPPEPPPEPETFSLSSLSEEAVLDLEMSWPQFEESESQQPCGVVLTPSCTSALELAALVLGLGPGDEVLMPSYTFPSTANAFLLRGATPVFVDCNADSRCMSLSKLELALTPRSRAVVAVHYGGVGSGVRALSQWAKQRGLFLIEDAAQAFLSSYQGRALGTWGDFGCLSFHHTKNITCGEGGALIVNRSSEFLRLAEIYRDKGTDRQAFLSGQVSRYRWQGVGGSLVPSELSMAMLWAQLEGERLQPTTSRRVELFNRYLSGLNDLQSIPIYIPQQNDGENRPSSLPLIGLPSVPIACTPNGHIFSILLPSQSERERMETGLRERNITALPHFLPLHSSPAGLQHGKVGRGSESMQGCDRLGTCLLRLPLWVGMTEEDVDRVVGAVREVALASDLLKS